MGFHERGIDQGLRRGFGPSAAMVTKVRTNTEPTPAEGDCLDRSPSVRPAVASRQHLGAFRLTAIAEISGFMKNASFAGVMSVRRP